MCYMSEKKNEQPVVSETFKEHERLKKKEKNRLRQEQVAKDLEDYIEELDDATYALVKKFK